MKPRQKTKRMLFVLTIFIGIITYFLAQEREPVTLSEGDHSEKSGKWHVSYGGNSPWQDLAAYNVTADRVKLGDFNGDGKTDVFTTRGGKWYISYGGNSSWQYVMTSNVTVDRMELGDFNGDGKTDLFTTLNTPVAVIPHSDDKQNYAEYKALQVENSRKWYVSYNGNSHWKYLINSNVTLDKIKFGDFNGDGKTDAFATWGGKWHVSYGGNSPWQDLAAYNVTADRVKLGDFNGDGKTDVFTTRGGKWYISYGGNSSWQYVMTSNVTVDRMELGDFNGDGKTDLFTTLNTPVAVIPHSDDKQNYAEYKALQVENSRKWYVSYNGNSHWKYLINSNVTLDKIKFGDFNGDGKTDAFANFNTPQAVIPKPTDKQK